MELNKIKQRLELPLRPAEEPTLKEVLVAVEKNGVLRGPVDWVFSAWIIYVEYATQRIVETFQLTEDERRQLFHFRDTLKRLLREAWIQTKEKLAALYKAVSEGTYKLEGNRLYAPDGTWMYIDKVIRIPIHGISIETYFPNVLKLPRKKLELLQLGWRASDEGNADKMPYMGTTQPWQMFAWAAVRYGKLRLYVASTNLTHEGVSVRMYIKAKSWKQKWNKDEAVDLVVNYFRHGEWTPLFSMWLGDGEARRKKILRGDYKIIIAAKEPWRLGSTINTHEALVASGKDAFKKLVETADVYGELLDLLRAHKWIDVKLATNDALRVVYKLKTKRRSIDVLMERYGCNNVKVESLSHEERNCRQVNSCVVVMGIEMYLYLVHGRGGSLFARRRVRNLGEALAIANRLETAGLKPNVVRSGNYYLVYVVTADLVKLAEKDEVIRKTIALYLIEKVKNGTPRQREIAEKILKRHPFLTSVASSPS